MDISGAVLRRSALPSGLGFRRDISLSRFSASPKSAAVGGFSDKGYLAYYASSVRCGGGDKKREKLVKGLAKDLAALCESGVDVDESRRKTITEAAQMLMSELNQLREREKEMKRRKKEEKAAMKAAAKMKRVCAEDESSSESGNSDCEGDAVIDTSCIKTTVIAEQKPESPLLSSMHGEVLQPQTVTAKKTCSVKKEKVCAKDESSSSESSESSESDCEGETVVNTSNLKTMVVPKAKSESPAPSMCSKVLQPQTTGIIDNSQDRLKIAQNISSCSSNNINSRDFSVNGARTSVVVEKSTDKIEVCMGGKCKRSGAVELLQEFEKKIGMEGAVVGCKCMGKCKEGPNVRVVTQGISKDLNKGMKNPLCIGVGVEDIPMIVANFLGNEDEMGLMAA